MTISKKIISLILAALICFTTLPMAWAGDIADISRDAVTEVTQPGTGEQTYNMLSEKEQWQYDDDTVALLYVYLVETKIHPMGHTWVYIENLTDKELQIGLYTVPAYEGVSVGVFARKDGWGVYYNVEAYSQTAYGMENQISMKEELDEDGVEAVSDAVINFVNHWDPFFNCMYFAFKVWNSGSNRKLIPLIFPIIGKLQMFLHRHEYDAPMKPVTKEQTFKQRGFSTWAYMEPATDKSLGPV